LGPLVTDVAPGYDHLVSAIGGAVAALAGADFLCYVTPAEHLGLPSPEDVREGVTAAKIAGHAVDVCRGVPGAAEWDRRMSAARKRLDWAKQVGMAISPHKASEVLASHSPGLEDGGCTMCGEFCAYRMTPAGEGKRRE
jgi:phosphomethylpyrimidine synthase